MKKIILLAVLPLLFLPGCVQQVIPAKRLMGLSVGMSKEQVINVLGEPNTFRGASTSAHGGTLEIYEYWVDEGWPADTWHYWLYFKENKLTQWGRTTDWLKPSDTVQEIRLR